MRNQRGAITSGNRTSSAAPDYAILPFSCSRPRALENLSEGGPARPRKSAAHTTFVTEYWLERSVRETTLVPSSDHILYRPCEFPLPLPGFSDLSISISGFEGLEREHISRLITFLGGTCTERFSRKNTHLICFRPQGPKFVHASKWSIPVIEVHWLYACATEGTALPIGGFIVSVPPPAAQWDHPQGANQDHHHPADDSERGMEVDGETAAESDVLQEVTLCFSPKLQSSRYPELSRLAASLGAKSFYHYDPACTHLVHEGGKPNETFREFKLARSGGKYIVSPHWLLECRRQGVRLREMDFPHTFNPSRVLSTLLPAHTSPAKAVAAPKFPAASAADLDLDGNGSQDEGNFYHSRQQNPETRTKGKEKVRPEAEGEAQRPLPTTERGVAAAAKKEPNPAPAVVVPKPQQPQPQQPQPQQPQQPQPQQPQPQQQQRQVTPLVSRQEDHQLPDNLGESNESLDMETCMDEILRTAEKARLCFRRAQRQRQAEAAGPISANPQQQAGQKRRITPEEGAAEIPSLPISKRLRSFIPLSKIEDQAAVFDEVLAPESESPSLSQVRVTYDDPNGRKMRDAMIQKLAPAAPKSAGTTRPSSSALKTKPKPELVFHITNILNQDEKRRVVEGITRLGGAVIHTPNFDAKCTHLVAGEPTRSEKYLAASAKGIWALKPQYVIDSVAAGHFLPEEPYEWSEAAASPG